MKQQEIKILLENENFRNNQNYIISKKDFKIFLEKVEYKSTYKQSYTWKIVTEYLFLNSISGSWESERRKTILSTWEFAFICNKKIIDNFIWIFNLIKFLIELLY